MAVCLLGLDARKFMEDQREMMTESAFRCTATAISDKGCYRSGKENVIWAPQAAEIRYNQIPKQQCTGL